MVTDFKRSSVTLPIANPITDTSCTNHMLVTKECTCVRLVLHLQLRSCQVIHICDWACENRACGLKYTMLFDEKYLNIEM